MEYLSHQEALDKKTEIQEAFAKLLENRAIVIRRKAKQWQFAQVCLDRLLGDDDASLFDTCQPVTLAQYKFEVEFKLRKFYLRPGQAQDFVFALMHQKNLAMYGIDEKYPALAGYCMLVRDMTGSTDETFSSFVQGDITSYFEKIISEAVDAEFYAYKALPEIKTESVEKYFYLDGPGYVEIMTYLSRHKERGWILSNPFNPSTKRLMSVKLKKIKGAEALLTTDEYWYLKWWDSQQEKYTYVYRETNRQHYVLLCRNGEWKVWQNLRPSPRTSNPRRWKKKQE
jgi:hypothetical protein